jgi:2-polyprenyl-6-methoxyphenol hydroxylase-like FAD-dependent oxidoreductase
MTPRFPPEASGKSAYGSPPRESSARAAVRVHGSGRAGLACAALLARAGYDVRVLDSDAGAYDAFEAFDGSAVDALRALGIDPFAACGARAVRGFNGAQYVVARREHVRAALFHAARNAGARIVPARGLHDAGPSTAAKTAPEADGDNAAWDVDATGRSALRTGARREPPALAYLFDGPPADALAMLRAPAWWGYRIGDDRGSTVAVVGGKPYPSEREARAWAESAFGVALGASPATRRAAGTQRAPEPVVANRIAVGDAALAQDPMNGQGQSFALTSAALAAATIRTCVERLALGELARGFYAAAVARAARHAAPRDDAPGDGAAGDGARVPGAVDLGRTYVFAGDVRRGGVLQDGLIAEELVVAWDGAQARWSAGVDLLHLAETAAGASAGWHVIDRLARRGVGWDRAVAVVSAAIARGLLRPV